LIAAEESSRKFNLKKTWLINLTQELEGLLNFNPKREREDKLKQRMGKSLFVKVISRGSKSRERDRFGIPSHKAVKKCI